MKSITMICCLSIGFLKIMAQPGNFETYPVYKGGDLGLQYSITQSHFRVWAPTAEEVQLLFYKQALSGQVAEVVQMEKSVQGTWHKMINRDLKDMFYVYKAKIAGKWMNEVADPYAFATGTNGKRSKIIDLKNAAPAGWETEKRPAALHAVDALIYELHIRDASIHAGSGIQHKGKYLGLAETGTRNAAGLSTGLDHIREMGVTHVHLLPFFDFLSVDESRLNVPQYNWGYEPLNYNVPEGSYATDAENGYKRIWELRNMIQTMHRQDIRVVMDVVYNHTMLTEESWFNQLVPGYYYRQTSDGRFSNATACGNEIASERPMVRKYIIESLEFWMREYHIDGFRVDLMGVHDITTMQQVHQRLKKINPAVLIYGEGWAAGESPVPETERALKKHAAQLKGIAVFSDDIRDGIKGSVFIEKEKGFVSGRKGMEESIRFGVVASCRHPQIDYSKVNYSKAPYADHPYQTVTYTECHDNHVLWDKLALSAKGVNEAERIQMHKLALSIVLTSQGIPFLHAGTEFLRTKQGNENSYNAGDSINAIDWDLKTRNQSVVNYVQALIKLRKDHPAFRYRTGEKIRKGIRFIETPENMVAYTLDGSKVKDSWKKILVVYYARSEKTDWELPAGKWQQFQLPGQKANYLSVERKASFDERGCFVYFQE